MVHLRTLVLKKIINVNLSLLTVPLISDWEFKMLLLKLLKSTGLFLKKTAVSILGNGSHLLLTG